MLQLQLILLAKGHSVHNVDGSSKQKTKPRRYSSWKKLWIGETPWEWSRQCANEHCYNEPYGGSHVFIGST